MHLTVPSPLAFRRRFLVLALRLAATVSLLAGIVAPVRAAGTDDRVFFPNTLKPQTAAQQAAMASSKAVDPAATVEFMFTLRMRDLAKVQARVAAGERISQQEMAARYYPLDADYQALAKWARGQGFKVVSEDPTRLAMSLSGPVALAEKALGTRYAHVTVGGKDFLAAQAVPSLPAKVAAPLLTINGLQPYLQARRHTRQANPQISNNPPYLIHEILRAYSAENLGVTGAGQTIAILIDTVPNDTDLLRFWQANSIPQSLANVTEINVNGVPLPPATGEETLDVSWTSGIAPAAKINVYAAGSLFFTDLDKSFQRIIQDLNNGAAIGQLSISLGLGELDLGAPEIYAEAQYFVTIANFGVSVFVSTGDDGADPDGDNRLQVSYQSTDPNVTAVGGTSLFLDGTTGQISRETVWNESAILEGATGGGTSGLFVRPSYQQGPGVPDVNRRMVPDVASAADPETGCYLFLNGQVQQFGGTSWSAPTWAGFSALINQARQNLGLPTTGLLNPYLYPLIGTNNFRDIVEGNNINDGSTVGFQATPGYDQTTGIGTPIVSNLLATLTVSGRFTLSGFSPTSGVPGAPVTITGTRLDHTVSVSFNGAAAAFTKTSAVQLVATVPAGATTGTITLVDDAGTVQTSTQIFTVLAAGAGANDAFVNAQVLGQPPLSVTGTNVHATREPGEPDHAGRLGGASVWYRWTAPNNGVYAFNTNGSSFDTLLAVYTGPSVAQLTEVVSNDDASGLGTASSVAFQATAGTVYSIAVDGLNPGDGSGPAEGLVVLNFTNTTDQPLVTDFSPPRGAVGHPVRVFGANFLAVNAVQFNGVAATFTVNSNTQLTAVVPQGATTGPISVTDTAGNTAFSVGNFTVVPVPANDNFANGTVIPGGTATLNGTNAGASKEPGEPDHAGDAGGASVWFTWTAPATGAYSLSTVGSDFDTLLAVDTGNTVGALTQLAANDDAGTNATSILAFNATAGQTYHFAVDGFGGAIGNYTLRLQPANGTPAITTLSPATGGPGVDVSILGTGFTTATAVRFNGTAAASFHVDSDVQISVVVPNGATTGPVTVVGLNGTAVSPVPFTVLPAPANDNFANAQVLPGGVPITVTGTNAGASKETGETQIIAGDDGGRSVWYTWTPAVSGTFAITTRGSDFDTLLGVYTGSTLPGLTLVAANDDDADGGVTSSVTVNVTRGSTYHLVVDGAGGDAGNVTLSILSTTAVVDLYNTSFDAAEGYTTKAPLVGQRGWRSVLAADGSVITGGNGVLANQFPSLDQQGYVGLTPLSNQAASLQVYQDLGYSFTADNPVVSFSALVKIAPSTNGHYDRFSFTADRAAGNGAAAQAAGKYFSLIFDNATGKILYQLNDGNAPVDTGVTFSTNVAYSLQMSLDFLNNAWGATLNGATLVNGAFIDTQAYPTALTRISADWTVANPANPGDNFLVFDQYSVTAPTIAPPTIEVQPISQTLPSGSQVVFSVVATGTPPLTYQWYFQGIAIPGATASTFTINAASTGSAGRYSVNVTNNYGTTSSLDAILVVSTTQATVNATVSITALQSSVSASSGEKGLFQFTRTGNFQQALVVNYQVKGSAQAGVDYQTLNGQFTFKPGQAKKKVKILPVDRGLRDGSTVKVNLKLLPGNGYSVSTPNHAKILVERN